MFPEEHVKTWTWCDTWYRRTLRWAVNDGCPDENYLPKDTQTTESRPCCLYHFACPRQGKQVTHSITFPGDVKHLACPRWPGFVAGFATFRPGMIFGRKWEVREIRQSDSIFHWSKELPGRKFCQEWNFSLHLQHFANFKVLPNNDQSEPCMEGTPVPVYSTFHYPMIFEERKQSTSIGKTSKHIALFQFTFLSLLIALQFVRHVMRLGRIWSFISELHKRHVGFAAESVSSWIAEVFFQWLEQSWVPSHVILLLRSALKLTWDTFSSRALWISVNIGLKMWSANAVCHVTRKTRGPRVVFSNEYLLKLSLTSVSCAIYRLFAVRLKWNNRVFWSSFFAMFSGHLSLQCFLVIFLWNACSNRCTVVFGKESILSNDWRSLDIAFVCLARCEWHHQMRYHVYISKPPNIARHACRISMN